MIVTLVRGEKVTQAAPAQSYRLLFEGVVEFTAAWCISLHAAPGKNVLKSLGKGLDAVFILLFILPHMEKDPYVRSRVFRFAARNMPS